MNLREAKAVSRTFKTHPKPWYYLNFSYVRLIYAADSIDTNIYVVDVDREIHFKRRSQPHGVEWTVSAPFTDVSRAESHGDSERSAWDALKSNLLRLYTRMCDVEKESKLRAKEKAKSAEMPEDEIE